MTMFGAPHAPKLQDFSSVTVFGVPQSYILFFYSMTLLLYYSIIIYSITLLPFYSNTLLPCYSIHLLLFSPLLV